jgi:enoyl-CoA hydratase
MPEYKFLQYEEHDEGQIVRILLDRPGTRNAQNRGLLVELDDAFRRSEEDDRCRVVILGGTGPMFSSGHDMGSPEALDDLQNHPTTTMNGGSRHGAEQRMLQEWHYFFQNTLRWRNLRKITIAQVQGKTFAAGLMLVWACDLIVAADNAFFADVVGTRLGMCGVEYFGHPWEFGPRKTKELMLTGDAVGVDEAYALGMVQKIFPTDELSTMTLEYARRIAKTPSMAALLIKESVNQTMDNMGFHNSLQACFTLHQLNHSHWAEIHDDGFAVARPEDGVEDWKNPPPVLVSVPEAIEGPLARKS